MRTKQLLSVTCLLLILCSCGPIGGAARFWKTYKPELIVAQQSDQGPWGGHRWVQWESRNAGVFSEREAKKFAIEHGWKFLQRFEVSAQGMSDWKGFKQSRVFPLFQTGLANDGFPRRIVSDSIFLKFDSGWLREDPGTNEMSTAYGYLQVSKDGTQMAVYHLWGNS
jgi:hypothetical protein